MPRPVTSPRPENDASQFRLGSVMVQFDQSGALWLPVKRTLIFSDLHFEKGTSYGRKGLFLPPYDTRKTLAAMADAINRFQPRTVISLGDAFHDMEAEARMDEQDAQTLEGLTRQASWIWVLGNHDPVPPARFSGRPCEELEVAGLIFTHEPRADGGWHVAGHMHPSAKISRTGRAVRRRCFVTDGKRLILPAFGAYTGGLNILDTAYQPFFNSAFSAFMVGQEHVWQVSQKELRPDSASWTYRQ